MVVNGNKKKKKKRKKKKKKEGEKKRKERSWELTRVKLLLVNRVWVARIRVHLKWNCIRR